ncbi:hypothetical protein [Nocardia sp. NRRL S-836]|uniref:hypothetical protein n=1 Tax=Nocardia sp. NRRL S-836 TaxID=1519492 RepID=UPI0006C494C2|nr:hypothetical protein [Nocardia sp. NRRL S-836]KOV80314.1 hypothetical protein ADL03_32995 [Nocardia sp. NRRL S-836]
MGAPRSSQVVAVVAAVVVVAGLVFAYLQRPDHTDSGQSGNGGGMRCGSTVCQSIVGRSVGNDMVELLGGTGGGRIRVTGGTGTFIFEMTTAEAGATITGDSLLCQDAAVSVCLVRGPHNNKVLGEVLVRKNGTWSRIQTTYLASAAYLGLHDVNEDGVADIVAAQLACGGQCRNAFVQVFSALGPDIGCTQAAPAREQLPGWPTPAPKLSQLRPCTNT